MKWIAGGIALALLALALVSGAGVAGARSKKPQERTLAAGRNASLKFNRTRLTAKPGKIELVMKNPRASGLEHGIAVEGKGLDKKGKIVKPGKTSRVEVTLKRGTYTFYCPFPGHKAAGMRGKLVVG
jgi:uncharacterized cupredoxin-like copper-binding protein